MVSSKVFAGIAPRAGIAWSGRQLGVGSVHGGVVVGVDPVDSAPVALEGVVVEGGGPACGDDGLATDDAHPVSTTSPANARDQRRVTGTPGSAAGDRRSSAPPRSTRGPSRGRRGRGPGGR